MRVIFYLSSNIILKRNKRVLVTILKSLRQAISPRRYRFISYKRYHLWKQVLVDNMPPLSKHMLLEFETLVWIWRHLELCGSR